MKILGVAEIFLIALIALRSSSVIESESITEEANKSIEVGSLSPPDQRVLSQIKVEEDSDKMRKPQPKVKRQKKNPGTDHKVMLVAHIDKIIKEFGLDQNIDKQKVKTYFRGLEKNIYKGLSRSLRKNRKYDADYNKVINRYNKVAEKYNIK